MSQCLTCSGSNSCLICQDSTLFFNSSSGNCGIGTVPGCISFGTSGLCQLCNNAYFLDTVGNCVQLSSLNQINFC